MQVDYTLAAASAFLEKLAPQLPEGKQFRFVFCSGKFAEWDQKKALHFMADTRHIKVRHCVSGHPFLRRAFDRCIVTAWNLADTITGAGGAGSV